MVRQKSESGQALILIVFAIVALIGLTGLAIDGGNAYSDRRNAQNAADTAAMAGALYDSTANAGQPGTPSSNITAAAKQRASSNGYDAQSNNHVTVNVTVTPVSSGGCPSNGPGDDVQVDIVSNVGTYFARVMGFNQFTNHVTATARACFTYTAPLFNGNSIVGLCNDGKCQDFNGIGTPDWYIQGGGIFSNSSALNSAYCNGAAGVNAPSVTSVGSLNSSAFSCHSVNIGSITGNATPFDVSSYMGALQKIQPQCKGTAYGSQGQWYPDPDPALAATGSKVAFSGSMNFNAGLYCVTNSPGPYHDQITTASGVTFYIENPNFSMSFNGGGGLVTGAAPTTGPYAGLLMFSMPQTDANGNLIQTQSISLLGNGSASVQGSVLMPSANVNVYGNSGPNYSYDSQIVGYTVTAGGNSDIHINYNANDNYKVTWQASIKPLK